MSTLTFTTSTGHRPRPFAFQIHQYDFMLGQVRFISRQKCFIRVRRLLCSEDTSKVSSKTFSSFRWSAAAIFASGIASATAIFTLGIMVFNSLNVFKDFYSNYPVYKAIIEDTRPVIMKMIEGDLTTKLCEKSASITEFYNVGDGCDYVTRLVLENCILQASEQSLKNKGGVHTIIVGAKGVAHNRVGNTG